MASVWDKKWEISVRYEPHTSDSLGLVDSIPDLSKGQVKRLKNPFKEIQITEELHL